MHPQRNTFTFTQGLTISSNFDSGNLWKCIKKVTKLPTMQTNDELNVLQESNL